MGNGLGLNFLVRFKTDWIQESNKLIRSRSKGRKIQSIQATKLIPFQLNQLFTTIKDEGRKENLAQKELNNLKSYGICFFIGQRNFNNKIKINRNMFCSLFFLDIKYFYVSWLSLHLRLFRSSLCILFISNMNLTINSINNIFPDPEIFFKRLITIIGYLYCSSKCLTETQTNKRTQPRLTILKATFPPLVR